jgi:integrase/recombinase XerD
MCSTTPLGVTDEAKTLESRRRNGVIMLLSEMMQLFMDSRKRGIGGARKKAAASTLEVYERNLDNFFEWLTETHGILKYDQIRRLHMVQFLDWLTEKESSKVWSKSTCLQLLRSVKTFYNWVDKDEDCQEQGLHGLQKYLPTIEKAPRRTDIPDIKDLKTFRNTIDIDSKWGYRDFIAVSLMLSTGIRVSELCTIELSHIKLEDQLLVVTGKTGTRVVPLSKDIVLLLKGWYKRRQLCPRAANSPYLFTSKYSDKMHKDGFGKRFRQITAEAGIGRITAHTFRHSFCTNYLRKGGDIEKLRTITGHTTYAMLLDYLHMAKLGSQAMKEEIDKVSILKDMK